MTVEPNWSWPTGRAANSVANGSNPSTVYVDCFISLFVFVGCNNSDVESDYCNTNQTCN